MARTTATTVPPLRKPTSLPVVTDEPPKASASTERKRTEDAEPPSRWAQFTTSLGKLSDWIEDNLLRSDATAPDEPRKVRMRACMSLSGPLNLLRVCCWQRSTG